MRIYGGPNIPRPRAIAPGYFSTGITLGTCYLALGIWYLARDSQPLEISSKFLRLAQIHGSSIK